ncbi:MAG: hypothetical protein HC869_24745 [Rhodospirillales bacterium]|nr:hypothetical protein [Rhodospirillales bacterium]
MPVAAPYAAGVVNPGIVPVVEDDGTSVISDPRTREPTRFSLIPLRVTAEEARGINAAVQEVLAFFNATLRDTPSPSTPRF